ncbi:agmatine/peptidylarginine deiminase [Tahibacter aquaticus]|uniref:Agmatine/peptidylarginine deiminase n=1 Tax=Tahibacter aquaticus TaxID=520092 RepID=A0A4R6Z2H9_9GAMM|nr:agmatine deiminase family protein [Tahibacter aquaticus]TDR45790.1 agmatine/peptidylarginine deiminase [Tahibacter aquaticus]
MRKSMGVGLMLVLAWAAAAAQAQVPKTVAPEVLALIQDDEPYPLPRNLSAEERARWQPPDLSRAPQAPPAGPVRAQAEYEDNSGILVRWGTQNALLTQMAVAITTGDPDAFVYVVVTGATQQSSASATLNGAGAVMSRIRFISQACSSGCSVWMRDYGPRFIDAAGHRAAVDHSYNRPRPIDDAFPGVWAGYSGEAKYDIPLVHGGGNFHLFRNRDAFMTRLIVNENAGVSEQQIKDYYRDYQGLNLTLTTPFPASYDSTQHIDMWMLPLADDKVLISSHASTDGVPYTVTEDTAALMTGRGYTVYRTPAWLSGGTHYTYANAVLLNKVALVCQFSGYATQNAAALATFAAALPERSVVGVDCSGIIGLSGAIHCIVMHVPDLLFRDDLDG